jgi:beta-lactamase class A
MLKTLVSKAQKIDGTVGFVLQDLRKNFRRDWNAEEVFPAASVIKLTILWELFRRVDEGELSLHEEMELRETAKVGGFGILKEMHPGLRPSLEDLATLMIILSDNMATNILIDLLGMEAINRTATELGLHKTVLQRKMMDGEAKARGLDNFTSPEDMAHLLWHYMESPDLSESSRKIMLNILLRQQCNNKLPLRMPLGAPLAHKTGDLPGTEHDVGILLLPKQPIILVVMTKDLSRNQDGIAFCNKVGELLYTTYLANTFKE